MENYLIAQRESLPTWLEQFSEGSKFIAEDFFSSRIIFYPGSGFDGQPVKLFGSAHAGHCFVYADYGVSEYSLAEQLDDPDRGFRGYKQIARIPVTESDIATGRAIYHVTPAEQRQAEVAYRRAEVPGRPYGFLQVMQRSEKLDYTHGARRLAILFLCADGFATFDRLFCQGDSRPLYAAVLQDHGSGDNYESFGRHGLAERIAGRTGKFPTLLLCGDNTAAWDGYLAVEQSPPSLSSQSRHRWTLYYRDCRVSRQVRPLAPGV